jgi:transcriptional regulator with XRE-family HTH domain
VKPTLGQYLASIRLDRRMSLRQVEEASQKQVSNAYLSQLENEKIQQPSPIVLNLLAEIYGIDYLQLMELAGYMPTQNPSQEGQRHGRAATFAEHNLSADEEAEMLEFLKYLRMRKKK